MDDTFRGIDISRNLCPPPSYPPGWSRKKRSVDEDIFDPPGQEEEYEVTKAKILGALICE